MNEFIFGKVIIITGFPHDLLTTFDLYIFGRFIIITGRHHNLLTNFDLCIFLVRKSPSPSSAAISYRFITCSLTSLQTCCQLYVWDFLIVANVTVGIYLLLLMLQSGFTYCWQCYGRDLMIALIMECLVYCRRYGQDFPHWTSQARCDSSRMLLSFTMLRSISSYFITIMDIS